MGKVIRILAALLIAAFFLIAGNGLQGTLLAVRGNLEGFPLLMVGFLMSAYYVGFIGGCRIAPLMVKRVGHIRSFTALASVASAAALAYALAVNPVFWIVLRIVTGFCMAGLYMIIESWINENATNERRGRILSIYRITDLTAGTLGQALLAAADPTLFSLFAVVSILISLALVPVALTNSAQPRPIASAKLDLEKLFRISPLAAAGCLCVGAANGAFWAVGAVYVQQLGYDVRTIAVFMTTAVIGGALSQWPLGLASDRMDRRIIIIIVSSLCAASGAFLAATGGGSGEMLLYGAFAFGFTAMPIFGLCVAHANDRAEAHEYVTLAAGLLLLYGVGAVIGPIIAPLAMNEFGPRALFIHTAVTYAVLAVFGLFRVFLRDAAPRADRESYVAVPRTSPAVFEIDPRVEAPDEAETTPASE
ncbi:MFS transporter [Hyphococcus sp.]|uniref:MFS transporter n=1 Tax=Hyphococcus sp. TaxID=2038636 RepID=UPI00207F0580|nr:MAG: MFS transporter [Marinicaulis sp.]